MITADTSEFKAHLALRDGILMDVRTPGEYDSGYIAGAINIDFRGKKFEQEIEALDSTRTYYVYCEVGGRSRMAAEYMLAHGFCRVVVLEGGMKQWKKAGYPVVLPPGTKKKKQQGSD